MVRALVAVNRWPSVYPMRMVLISIALFLAGCSPGFTAPDVGLSRTICSDVFCIEVPDGWNGEVGDTFVALNHELDPDNTFLTVGVIDQEAIVTSAGGTWPVQTDDVARAFWSLLEASDVGSFTRSQRMVGGAVRSWGDHESGPMWHVVYPTEGSSAIGVELRGPNDSWESHADVVFASIRRINE
jgi:hypothetical protein